MATTMRTATGTATGIAMSDAALYRLMAWLSPAYPVGAFSHSNGLEWAVETGVVADREALIDWLRDVLAHGSGWNDAVLFVHAWRAAGADDGPRLRNLAMLAAAANPSRERRLETTAQGTAFRRISRDAWPAASLGLLEEIDDGDLAYPIAVAALAAGHGVALAPALTAYLHAVAANIVSAAQRLVPLGQTDGQRAIAALADDVAALVERAVALDDGDPFRAMGGCTLAADLAAIRHETQYTRLFRT
ncbi:MAG: urease accessory protein UreF [Reyranellaceae bacterium]